MTYETQQLTKEDVEDALRRAVEISQDTGTATGGTDTTLVDATKNWATDMWARAIIQIKIGGIEYIREVSSNTDNTITFSPSLPAGIVVTSGSEYAIRKALQVADIRNIERWGGSALTGRDISLDLANLNIPLDTRASEATLTNVRDRLPSALSVGGNLKTSIEEATIAVPVDLQYSVPHSRSIAQLLSGYSLLGGASVDSDHAVSEYHSGAVVTVRVAYNVSATAGVRLETFFSPDGTNFDTEAVDTFDLPFTAGATIQKSYIIACPCHTLRLRLTNLDATYGATVDMWIATIL